MDIKVPQLAEGVDSGTVVNILVSAGDRVEKGQSVVELETSKAIAPIPSPASGTVERIHVKEGDEVNVGDSLLTVSEAGGAGKKKAAPPDEAKKNDAPAAEAATEKPAARLQDTGETATEKPAARLQDTGETVYRSPTGAPPPASPSVRVMARQLGIDLTRVGGSARGGRITLEDLKAYIGRLQAPPPASKDAGRKEARPALPDFARWGPVRREKMTKLRKTIAERMQGAWQAVPHVTQFDEADVTAVMAYRKKYADAYEKKGGRLTLTSFVLKAACRALKQYPVLNSSLDEAGGEIIIKEYYHLGVAVDTEQGLIVPVIKDADKKSVLELSVELAALAEKARQRKVSIEELSGATFTVSNLGGLGVGHFTPIVNMPEVGILGLGRARQTGSGLMMPAALSYDHRVVDGAVGARFIRAFAEALEGFPEADVKS